MAGGEQLSKDLSLTEFRQFRDYIHQHSGIYLEESKLDSLRISLLARATRLDCPGWDAYFEILARDDHEFRELMSLVTINETSFFRFPAQFEALRTQVIPEIIRTATRDDHTVRIWSAGCSTGEEPYSIAMTLADSGIDGLGWRGEVMGTDVSTKALGIAKSGTYPGKALLNLPDEVVQRHFVQTGDDEYRAAAHVKRLIDFGYHNLIKEPYPLGLMGNWDVIFCRNVTIYFRLESTRRVVQNFYNSLNEGGYLFIGHSETLTSISDQFEPVEIGGVFLYRKPHRARNWGGVELPSMDTRARRKAPALVPAPGRASTPARTAAARPRADGPAPVPAAASVPTPVEVAVGVSPTDLLAKAREQLVEGRLDDALATVGLLLTTDHHNAEAHLILAHVYADTGAYERALAECTTALAVNPLLPGARYVLGIIHQRQGDLVRAVSELKKTVYIDPDFALAHLSLGNIYRQQGRYDVACRQYENAMRALRKSPEGEWALYMGGWTADVVLRTCERSLLECRKATGAA